ncbi:MAG: acetyl-CoA carboxylase carboxyltransferase subunit beta [Alphaproteobacteria bacterium]|nr:acetyl-CoA carboxylase carboxyltransferase subunit beta [Alphaproteobacteria bacterium]HRI77352.1 acetyl-CoA carboxylase, carboxyltransferase subunit beta [Alphaproteobacteria bacterium]
MNWINNFVRPKIKALADMAAKKDVPDNLWHKCPGCDAMLHHQELQKHLHVCHHCGYHLRVDVMERLGMLFDGGEYQLVDLPKTAFDPLKFKDRKKYTDRLKDAQSSTGRKDAVAVAQGAIGGRTAVIAALDFSFMGGSMGAAVGDGLVTASRLAVMLGAPFIVIPASGGARMQEGMLSLMQMPRSVIAVEQVKEARLPYIVILTDPTTGGVSASFAMLGDIQIAEPGAQIGFAGRRVIQETIRASLPDGFQTAEYLRDHGMVDLVVPRKEMREKLASIISLLMDGGAAKPASRKAKANGHLLNGKAARDDEAGA